MERAAGESGPLTPARLAAGVLEVIDSPAALLDDRLQVVAANQAFDRALGLDPGIAAGRLLHELPRGRWDAPAFRSLPSLPDDGASGVTEAEVELELEADGSAPVLVTARVTRLADAGLQILTLETSRLGAVPGRPGENEYRSLLQSAAQGYCIIEMLFDENGRPVDYRFVETNEAFERHTGLVNATGKTARELVPDLDESWFEIYGNVALTGDPVRFENHAPAMGRWFDVYAMRVGPPEHRWVALLFSNVTERKEVVQALQESEQRLGAELQAMNDLYELTNRLLDTPDLESALQEVLNAAIALNEADMGNIQLLDPEDNKLRIVAHRGFGLPFLEAFREVSADEGSACARAMRTGATTIIEDVETDSDYQPYRAIAAAAGYRAVQSTPLRTRTGAIAGVLSTHHRTPHRPAERAQRMTFLYARQAADVIERYRDQEALRETNDRLRKANEVKDEFLGLVSHELRTPLTMILGNSKIMVRYGSALSPKDWEESLADIVAEGERLQRLIENMLLLTRLESGQVPPEPVALPDMIQECLQSFRRRKPETEVSVTIGQGVPPALGHASFLVQVLENLLSNADKYGDPASPIEVLLRRNDSGWPEVVVRDFGIGISPSEVEEIFKPFYRSQSRPMAVSGLGLGLTVCRRLIEAQGGRIWARARPEGGSDFCFTLPAAE